MNGKSELEEESIDWRGRKMLSLKPARAAYKAKPFLTTINRTENVEKVFASHNWLNKRTQTINRCAHVSAHTDQSRGNAQNLNILISQERKGSLK